MPRYRSSRSRLGAVASLITLATLTAPPALAQRATPFACGNEPLGTRPLPRILEFTLRTATDT